MAKVRKPVLVPVVEVAARAAVSRVFRSAYGAKRRVVQKFAPEGRTKQSFKAECDINNIMARYQRTGVLDFLAKHEGRYADVSGLDFQTAQDLIVGAKAMFMDLPAKVRSKFENDPGKFLAFMDDPENTQEAIRLGLAKAPVGDTVPPAKPVVEAPKAPAAAPEGAAGASK